MKGLFFIALTAFLLCAGPVEAHQVRKVMFDSQGQTLIGNLFLPDDYSADHPLPGVVTAGSWTSVKEQMPGFYAARLADKGFAVLAFDFRGWGESKDPVMYLEDPQRKTEDLLAAAAFLAKRPEIDPSRIGGLGICAGGGYMAGAALESDVLKSVALVAPWLHDAEIVDQVYGGKDGVAALMETGRQAEAKFKATGDMTIIPAAGNTDKTALMQQVPYYTETDRGLIPAYDNQFNLASWVPWLTYDAIKAADQLTKPVLIVHSESAAIPQGVKKFAARMGDRAKVVWLDQVTQFDFYDQPAAVDRALKEVVNHFQATLK